MDKRGKVNQGSAFMLLLLLYNIILGLLLGALYFSVYEAGYGAFFYTPWFILLTQIAGFILPLVLWLSARGEKLQSHLPNMKLGNINIILIIALSFFLQPAMMLLSALMSFIFTNPVADILAQMEPSPFLAVLAAMAVTPALCEEITFRGYILSQYKDMPFKKAALINGLFFGFMHLSAQQFLYAFAMGVIFAYFVHYTRSIRAGVLAHFFTNAAQLSVSRLFSYLSDETLAEAAEAAAGSAGYFDELLTVLAGLGIMTLIFLPGMIILFRTFLSHNRQRNMKYDMQAALTGLGPGETREIRMPEEDDSPEDASPGKSFRHDPFLWAAVAVYTVYIIFLA